MAQLQIKAAPNVKKTFTTQIILFLSNLSNFDYFSSKLLLYQIPKEAVVFFIARAHIGDKL